MAELPLSIFIIARQEGDRIGPTLEAVAGLATGMIVVDCGSEDDTVAVAREWLPCRCQRQTRLYCKALSTPILEAGSTVYTDESIAYLGMVDFKHEAVKHSVKEFVKDRAHTNGIESFWAILKI